MELDLQLPTIPGERVVDPTTLQDILLNQSYPSNHRFIPIATMLTFRIA